MKRVCGLLPSAYRTEQNTLSLLMQAKSLLGGFPRVRFDGRVAQDHKKIVSEINEIGWHTPGLLESEDFQKAYELEDFQCFQESGQYFSSVKDLLSPQVESLNGCYLDALELFRSEIELLEKSVRLILNFPVVSAGKQFFSSPQEILLEEITLHLKKPLRKSPLKSQAHFIAALDSFRRFEDAFYSSLFLLYPLHKNLESTRRFGPYSDGDVNFSDLAEFSKYELSKPILASSFSQILMLRVAFLGKLEQEIIYIPRVLADQERFAPKDGFWIVSAKGIEEITAL